MEGQMCAAFSYTNTAAELNQLSVKVNLNLWLCMFDSFRFFQISFKMNWILHGSFFIFCLMLWCPVKIELLCIFAEGSSLPMLQQTYDVQCVCTALAHTWTGIGLQTKHTHPSVSFRVWFHLICHFVFHPVCLQATCQLHTLKRSEEIVISSHINESTFGLHITFFHICFLTQLLRSIQFKLKWDKHYASKSQGTLTHTYELRRYVFW